MTDTYAIPEPNLPKLELRINQLARKAEKLGLVPPTLTVLGHRFVEEKRGQWPNPIRTIVRKVFDVQVTGQAPKLEGWTLVAIIDHFTGGERGRNIVRQVPSENEIDLPMSFRTMESRCDHCEQERYRKNTFALTNGSGEWKLVGSKCLKDFTGHDNPETLARIFQYLYDLLASASEEDWGGSETTDYIELRPYLAKVAAVIEAWGWMSRTRAREENRAATADIASDPKLEVEVTQAHDNLAKDAIAWVRALAERDNSLSNYEWNLVAACADNYLHYKNIGLAASAIIAYRRAMDLIVRKESEAQRPSEYVGQIKDRLEMDLTVTRRIDIETDYGPYGTMLHLTIMEDENGNIFVWKTSSRSLIEGEKYRVKGTVKAHEEYDGRKQTILTRCKVTCPICGGDNIGWSHVAEEMAKLWCEDCEKAERVEEAKDA